MSKVPPCPNPWRIVEGEGSRWMTRRHDGVVWLVRLPDRTVWMLDEDKAPTWASGTNSSTSGEQLPMF